MKIAMVVHSYYPRDVRVRRECESLSDRGDTVDVICLKNPNEAPTELVGNVQVYRLPVQHQRGQGPVGYIREYLAFFLRATLVLTKLHIKNRYPIIQIHNMPDFLVFVTIIPKLLGARVLLDMHDVTPELFQSLYGISRRSLTFGFLCFVERISLAYADAILTVNRNICQLFLNRNPIVKKIEVVMNSPDPRYFSTKGSVTFPAQGNFQLIHHGQILRRYSLEVVLEAICLVKNRIPSLKLDVYGDGEEQYVEELQLLVRTLDIQKQVMFHGQVPIEQIPNLIQSSQLGLVPCYKDIFVDRVMLPTRLLEYVTMGLPTVVSRVSTVETYFKENEVAYYPHNDPRALAHKIFDLYVNPKRRACMARRAKTAFQKYEWPGMQGRYFRTLDQLLSK